MFGVPVYSTYSEWLASPAYREGKQCQTCHMTATGTFDNLAPGKGGIHRDPHTLANHRFFVGSQVEMLKRCVTVDLSLRSGREGLQVDVEVRADQVGHRVPTGFADRNLLLVVEALDKDGQSLAPRSGPLLPRQVGKRLAGRSGPSLRQAVERFRRRQAGCLSGGPNRMTTIAGSVLVNRIGPLTSFRPGQVGCGFDCFIGVSGRRWRSERLAG